MAVTLAQVRCQVGDIAGNCDRILAAAAGCQDDFLVTPELSICGYPPEDLLSYAEFTLACERAAARLAVTLGKELPPHTHVVVGLPRRVDGQLHNVIQVLRAGEVVAEHRKVHLPNFGVFDELRHFTPGPGPTTFAVAGRQVALAICQDVWTPSFKAQVTSSAPDLLLIANASPFRLGVQAAREAHTTELARGRTAVVYVNMVGGQDEHIFDGGSHVTVAGEVVSRLPLLEETAVSTSQPVMATQLAEPALIKAILCVGIRDYVAAAGGGPVFVGVSGGIDSAVVLGLAAHALGPERVTAVLLPSRHTAAMSVEDGAALAANLGVRCLQAGIEDAFTALADTAALAGGKPLQGVAVENLQARVRGCLLMALANDAGGLVLTTGNKSEMATGYATLYGDMAGAYDVLKDLTKQRVYEMARHLNSAGEVIPTRVLERPPTAELRDNQLDSDSLPDYAILDRILEEVVEGLGEVEGAAERHGAAAARQFARLLSGSEFKRRQAPIGPTITSRAFGKDWRMPVSNRYMLGGGDDG